MTTPVLGLDAVGKSFPGVRALDGVSLELGAGEVLGVVGENGAGKSTLLKIVGGVYAHGAYDGALSLDGQVRRFTSAASALAAGIAVVHQELSLVPELTVAENLLLGREPRRFGLVDRAKLVAEARAMLARAGEGGGEGGGGAAGIDPEARVETLGVGRQQLVEIARALGGAARVVVLDEPTAALTDGETERLHDLVRAQRAQGTAFLYVSHRLDEIFALCDRVAVLRDGKLVAVRALAGPGVEGDDSFSISRTCGAARESGRAGVGTPFGSAQRGGGATPVKMDELVALMTGKATTVAASRVTHTATTPVVLEVSGLGMAHERLAGRDVLCDVSLSVRAGEIVALAGAMGSGRTALLSALYGLGRGKLRGRVAVAGAAYTPRDPRAAIAAGLALVPEDCKQLGLVLGLSVAENLALGDLPDVFVDPAAVEHAAAGAALRLAVKAPGLDAAVETLSGGNQQKIVLGRALATRPRLLLLDEPTRGVDVGARAEIFRILRGLTEAGLAVLMASSDLEEIRLLADRVVVLREGRVAGALDGAGLRGDDIMQLAVGQLGEGLRMSTEVRTDAPAVGVAPPPPRPGKRLGPGDLLALDAGVMLAVLLGLWTVLALLPATRDVFLTQRNLANLLTQVSPLCIVAVGMTLVILIRGIDLSVGAGVALTGVTAALLQLDHGQPAWVAIAAALAVGAAMGLWQGVWVSRFGLPAFVVSLAGFYAFRGLALVLSGSRGLAPMRDDFAILVDRLPPAATIALVVTATLAGVGSLLAQAARRRRLGLVPVPPLALAVRSVAALAVAAFVLALFAGRGLPVPVLLAGATVVAGVVLTRRTRFGRHLYAIGGNPEAARLAGIDVRRATLLVYVVIGVCTALAGLVLAARTNGVTPGNAGQLFELDVVTAVVIGGTSLMGGRGTVVGSLLGALVFGTLANAMNLLEVNSNWQLILKGLILMGAVLVDVLSKEETIMRAPTDRVFAFALAAGLTLAALGAAGCKSPDKSGKPKVAFLLSTLQEERYQKDQQYFVAKAEALGLATMVLAADNDNARQLAQVEDALTRGAKVLVIQPTDSKAAAGYVRLAHEAGAKVVAYDRAVLAEDLDYYVAHDSYQVGVIQATAALEATGGKGRYVILEGQEGHSVSGEITRGYTETLAPYLARGDVVIVARQSHSAWSPEQALRTVEDVIVKQGEQKIDAILANNSGMARGAVQAVQKAGLTGVFIAGADADAANVSFVCEGKQSVEVLKDIQPLAEAAAEVAAALARGETPKSAGTITLGGVAVPATAVRVVLVTSATVKTVIVDSGFLPAAALPGCAGKLAQK